jgi:hypothetical protein
VGGERTAGYMSPSIRLARALFPTANIVFQFASSRRKFGNRIPVPLARESNFVSVLTRTLSTHEVPVCQQGLLRNFRDASFEIGATDFSP